MGITFYVGGHINRHSCRIWGTEQSHGLCEYVCDITKVGMRCVNYCMIVRYDHSVLAENTFFLQLASTVLIGPWPSLMDFSIHRHLVGLLG
jgi:hypothetical protein